MNEKKYFHGSEISEYGVKNGYVDYLTLAKSFSHILNNDIIPNTYDIGEWEVVCGCDYDEETEEYKEVFQYWIVPEYALATLEEANEIVYHNKKLDLFVWGVTHWGTSWDYVLTDIKITW